MCTCLVHKTSAVYQSLGCRGCSVGQGSAGSAATGGQAPFPARHHRPTQGPGQDRPPGGETTHTLYTVLPAFLYIAGWEGT